MIAAKALWRREIAWRLGRYEFEVDQASPQRLLAKGPPAGAMPDVVLFYAKDALRTKHVALIMRLADRWPGVPIIAASGADDYDTVQALTTAGAVDVIPYDTSHAALVIKIRDRVRHRRAATSGMRTWNGVQCDPVKRTLSVDGKTLELQSRVYQLFSFLLDRADTVVSPADILRYAWGMTGDRADPETLVRVDISYLRDALGQLDRAHLLVTKKGRGYILYSTDPGTSATGVDSGPLGARRANFTRATRRPSSREPSAEARVRGLTGPG